MDSKKLSVGTFMGNTQKLRSLSGFTLSRTDHSEHMKVPKHEHEYPYISLLLHGLYHEKSIVSEHDIKAGASLFRPKGFEHKNEIGANESLCFNIEIQKDIIDKKLHKKAEGYIQFERNNLEVMKIYYAFQNDFSEELLNIVLEENLYQLFQEQRKELTTGRALWVNKVKQEIRLSPERIYSIDSIAKAYHLHPNYFVRKFKEATGFTFGEFLLRQRISKSIDLMLSTNKNLTEVAIESGFYDQSHFIRHFKSTFKTSPSHYRKTVKG